MDKKVLILLSALLAVAAVFSAAFMGARLGAGIGPEAAADGADTEETAEPLEAGRGIAIPGYDEIRLKANETEQTVYFYNPTQNSCFFVISLMIDGMEI